MQTTTYGLTQEEAQRRLALFGRNVLVPEKRGAKWRRLLQPALDPMVLLLLIAGGVYMALGETRDAAIMAIALVPVVGINWALEVRAEESLTRLRQHVLPRTSTYRDGALQLVSSDQLVPGDVCEVREGDAVPADGVVIGGSDLVADESALTGESLPVSKAPLRDGQSPQPDNTLLAGTVLASGQARMEVRATGPRTEYGKTGALAAQSKVELTPLERGVRQLLRQLGVLAALVCLGVLGLEVARGAGWGQAVIAAVGLAMAAVPEELPVVFTLYLSIGVWQMARRNALVRRLQGVETLGSTTVICTDKTGTLTKGVIHVAALAPSPQVAPAPAPDSAAVQELLRVAALACEVDAFDPLEQALLAHTFSQGVTRADLYTGRRLVHENSFDASSKTMSHIWQEPDGAFWLYAKGALEGILSLCNLTPSERDAALAANQALAGAGMRVIAVARKRLERVSGRREEDEAGATYLGVLGFADEPRPEVRDSISECQQAGIRVIMVTGDHPLTAHWVAEQVGLTHPGERVVTGSEIDGMDAGAFREMLGATNILARITPSQKHRVVRGLKEMGEVVAMTGDGINDVAALREAHVSAAMGKRGTEVARSVSTLVLLDDNFHTIEAAVRLGRQIYDNLQRAFRYIIVFHIPIIASALLMPLVGAPLLLHPVHLVWLELVLHPIIALVYPADPPDGDLMRRPPRPAGAFIIDRGTFRRLIGEGLLVTVAVVGSYLVLLGQQAPEAVARTVALAVLLFAQMFLVLMQRSPSRPFWRAWKGGNRALPWLGVAALGSLALLVHIPPLAAAVGLQPLSVPQWGIALALAALACLPVEATKGAGGRAGPRTASGDCGD
ncbi:MAG: cation-transporting P-type ATPase [Chloroflexi bacterium]|nr:cation-transporting P-type ATPase [Chloroflexota bacterium]